jgi:hypothetical protein
LIIFLLSCAITTTAATATVTPFQLAFLLGSDNDHDDNDGSSLFLMRSPLFWADVFLDFYFVGDIALNFVRPVADRVSRSGDVVVVVVVVAVIDGISVRAS